ncbi:PREDICTED: acrosin-like [Chaetura pelagica]|uniref:acrosin-like n=1 Tax=Chaetura pelagica TaxID=8897 RepID=UPI0005231538|nr:PREDICTED: acrosin-like [Chaetura pelagica]
MTLLLLLILLALGWPVHSTWDSCGACGLRPLASGDSKTRVVGGTNAAPGTWPWIISLQDPARPPSKHHICGGSLISSQWVITAAHCFLEGSPGPVDTWRVVIGANRLSRLGPEVQVRHIGRVLIHEHYDNVTQSNDIALLQLNQPVQCSAYIQLACVPDASVRVTEMKTCYVSGWGATTARSTDVSDVLQEAKVLLIDVTLCNSTWWYRGEIHTHNLCAGYAQGVIDTCQGDSGGPLVCKDDYSDHFWLVGITSWGKGCARVRRPGIYTSTQHFYDWILMQMTQNPPATETPAPQPVFTSTPFERPSPTPTQSGCLFPLQKLTEFFTALQELLQYLKGLKA